MGPTPAKVGRIIARDTQTTWPDPWSYDVIDAEEIRTWDQLTRRR
jgi:hypothetical protein